MKGSDFPQMGLALPFPGLVLLFPGLVLLPGVLQGDGIASPGMQIGDGEGDEQPWPPGWWAATTAWGSMAAASRCCQLCVAEKAKERLEGRIQKGMRSSL